MKTPNSLPRPPGELEALERAWRRPRGWRALTSVNNTRVGRLYLATAFAFFLIAGVLALLMRLQLAQPGGSLVEPETYNQLFTMHGSVMMFLFALPLVEAIAVYLLPGMLGARDLPFPRLSAYAYWAYAFGGAGFVCSLLFGVAPDGGWFMYPPLTGKTYSPGLGADFWLLGIGFIEISAIAGAVELIVGILFTRAPGMTLHRMPVFAWAMLVVAVMVVLSFPPLIAGTALLELERAFDWPFFIPQRGGDPLLWQHLFWFFGHPEVYIIFLPAAGLVSTMLPALVQTPLVGRRLVVWSLAVVGVLSFALWMHHMFTAGLGMLETMLVSAASMAIAIPTAVQVFAWIATLRRGAVQLNAPMLFILGFLLLFALGGLTGVMVAVAPFDWQAHDTYFVVAHMHYVLVGGLVFPTCAAAYFYFPLLNGHRLSERLARWVFGLMFVGMNVAFFPMHASGLLGMPRRVYTYDGGMGWTGLNLASSIGAGLLALGVLLLVIDALRVLRLPARAHGNPWRASGLEWLPSDEYATRSIPQVRSSEPLWRQDGLASEVESGMHWLPGTATGRRETLVTAWRDAGIRYLLVLPGDGWLPFLCALGTAGFFLLLTVQQPLPAACLAALMLATLAAWLWQLERPPAPTGAPASAPAPGLAPGVAGAWPPARVALVGGACAVPVGVSGWALHARWAVYVLAAVDGAIFLSLAYTLLHLAMALQVCPPPGARLPAGWTAAAGAILLALSSSCIAGARRWAILLLPAALCMAGAFGLELWAQWQAGLAPSANAWSAAVAALTAWQALHAGALVAAAALWGARAGAGLPLVQTACSTALLWHCAVLQAVASLALPRLL